MYTIIEHACIHVYLHRFAYIDICIVAYAKTHMHTYTHPYGHNVTAA